MSEIRSWDGECCGMGDNEEGIFPTIFSPGKLLNQHHNIKVRVVAWPEGAPKQEDVPQAGELVKRKEVALNYATFKVANGIPYLYQNFKWYLRVYSNYPREDATIGLRVEELERIPPTQPQTYTEDEIRKTVSEYFAGSGKDYIPDEIMSNLRRD